MLKELVNHFPDLLVFSIDSIYPQKHDENRKFKGVFDSVVKSIKFLKYPIIAITFIY